MDVNTNHDTGKSYAADFGYVFSILYTVERDLAADTAPDAYTVKALRNLRTALDEMGHKDSCYCSKCILKGKTNANKR